MPIFALTWSTKPTYSSLNGTSVSVFDFLRGCLTKNHPLNLAQKIILPETLATERLYQG